MVKRPLIFSILFLSLSSLAFGQTPVKGCGNISATVQVTLETENSYTAVVNTERFKAPMKFIFFNERGERLGDDFDSNKLQDLKPGEYFCVVKDSKGCSSKVKFKVEPNSGPNE